MSPNLIPVQIIFNLGQSPQVHEMVEVPRPGDQIRLTSTETGGPYLVTVEEVVWNLTDAETPVSVFVVSGRPWGRR